MNASDSITASETERLTRRYPGARPFRDEPDDHALFFGRNPEIEQLYLRVLSVSLLVQFAKSGLGKTSLLQAGLFPCLRQKLFLPILVRLNQEEPLVYSVTKAMGSACLSEGLEFTAGDTSGLWEFLASTIVWRDDLLLTPVLVFDQFEEVFTLRSKAFREELARELAALASGNPPERLRAARTDTSQALASRARIHPPKVKIIVTLREEYLGALEEFSLVIPQLFEERLRLGPISELGAREAIERPASQSARVDGAPYWSPPFEFESQAIERIIAFLKGKSGVIEPFQLQLLCQHAEDVVFAKSKASAQTESVRLTLADLGDVKGLASVLERFYKNTINKLPKSQRSKARRLCEEGLLDSNGHRLMLGKEQIHSDYRVTEEALETLAHERLLVREPRLDSIFYEISHDRLAESIQRAQPFRLPRKLRRRLVYGGVIALIIIAAVGSAVGWGLYKTNQERLRVEKLLSFMLGEKLQAEMRDVGRGDILEWVQEKSEQALEGTSFNKGLAFRNSGNLHRARGHIDQATQEFGQAQAIFEGLVKTEGDKAKAEWARTLLQVGDALSDSGELSKALEAYKKAVQIHREIVDRYPQGAPGELLGTYAWNSTPALELADALVLLGGLYYRMGAISEALERYKDAIFIAQDHLFDTAKSTAGAAGSREFESTPNPIAIKVLASAVLSRAINLHETAGKKKDFDQALFLMDELLRARPLSAEPHLAERQAIFWRATSHYGTNTEKTMAELKKVSDGFEMLRRVDSENALWRREWAVTQHIISHCVLQNCMRNEQNNQPLCQDKNLAMMEAERRNLEGVEQLRALVGKDPKNFSWQMDLADALLGRAGFLKENKQTLERMQVLNEAVLISSQSIQDDKDADAKSHLASAYLERAAAWQDQGNINQALEDMQQARAIYEGLVKEHPDHPNYRYELITALTEEIKLHGNQDDQSVMASLEKQKAEWEKAINRILKGQNLGDDYQNDRWKEQMEVANEAKKQNNPEGAIAAYRAGIEALIKDAEADPKRAAIWNKLAQAQRGLAKTLGESKRLVESISTYRRALQSAKKATEISPQKAQYQNDLGLSLIDLGDALQKNDELEAARDQFLGSLVPLQDALRLDPTEPVYYRNVRDVYIRIVAVDEALHKCNPESQDRLCKEREREWALRQRLYTAWKAKAFSSDQARDEQNQQLLMAKRDLAKFLTFEKPLEKPNREEALSLMQQELLDVKETVSKDPQNPANYCRLGEADYAIGFLQREQFLPGWEESIRKGLLAIDWGVKIAKREELICFKYSGAYRKKLGEYLLQDGRCEEGKRELEIALSASEKALQLRPKDKEIKRHIEEQHKLLKQNQ